ncbi:MAG: hypothetical protein VKP62_08860 [Candidatus Sericytochromatia bacterium]|nr:hypothetical protein [Candidatus Sericytochromatia bacterium]
MRIWFACFIYTLVSWLSGAALADTVADKPRLAVAIAGAPAPFLTSLGTKLTATRRFVVVDGPAAKAKLKGVPLNADLTLENARKARTAANIELLVDGKYENAGNQLRVTVRLFDFRTGEFSRDLGLLGEGSAAETLADQLVSFIRHADPLRCRVKDIDEDQIILDLGEVDGVRPGSLWRVFRFPGNVKPKELGTLRVTTVQPFAARAEAEQVAPGTVFERGDVLVEQTSGLLFP